LEKVSPTIELQPSEISRAAQAVVWSTTNRNAQYGSPIFRFENLSAEDIQNWIRIMPNILTNIIFKFSHN
jgi:hypothetical protein